ncbi:MAG: response regulator [Lachnospiraceae bacterium]|nr:response regulator [Lachnospiraceae bacterium]
MKQLGIKINEAEELREFMQTFKNEDFFLNASDVVCHISICDYRKKQLVNDMLVMIREFSPKIKVLGSTVVSEIYDGKLQLNICVVNFSFFRSSHVTIYGFECGPDEGEKIAEIAADKIRAIDDVKSVEIIANATTIDNVDTFFRTLKVNKDIVVFGCGSGGTFEDENNVLAIDEFFVLTDRILRNGIAVAVFSGKELEVFSLHSLGWRPIGIEHEITKMANSLAVSEIDGEPAIDFYSKYLGIAQDENYVKNTLEFPVVINREGVTIARAIGDLDKNKNLLFVSGVYEGEKIRLAVGNSRDIVIESKENALKIEEFQPEGLYLCICGSRQAYLQTEIQTELCFYTNVCDTVIGSSAFGEVSRAGETVTLFNFALVATAFREGPKNPDREIKYQNGDACSILSLHPLYDRMFHLMMVSSHEYALRHEEEKERALEEEIRVQKASNEAKSAFLSNMSHEIRTPINAVLGMNEMILRESNDENIREYANNIQSAGGALLSLVNDILDTSKIEAGKMEIIPVEYSLSSLLNDVIVMTRPRTDKKDLFIDVKVDENIPDLLLGDEIRIRQVLLNIFSNAAKYTEEGGVYFTVKESERKDDSITIDFSIRDTGIGIKEEDLSKLFSPFERIEEKRNRTIEGTGLGMNIVMNLLHMMDTNLIVDSVYGEGSDFHFSLKQKIVNEEPIGNFEERARIKNDTQIESRPFIAPGAKILVVDDTRMNLKVVQSLLKRTAIQVDTADSGEESIVLAKTNHYDIIFMDHRMPQMDGSEAMKKIRELPDDVNKNKNTPIIVLTANAVAGAKEGFLEEGFDDYLSKPVKSETLEYMILCYLDKELIIEGAYSEDESGISKDVQNRFKPYHAVEGLNIAEGIRNSGNADIYEEVLKEFVESAEERMSIMIKDAMEEDIRDFTIRVHSLKSSARLVGAIDLSERAEKLEKLGNDNNLSEVLRFAPAMLQLYQEITDAIAEVMNSQKKDDDDKELIEAEMLEEAYGAIKESVSAMDFDSADAVIKKLEEYKIPESEAEKYQQVKAYIRNVNYDEIMKIL